MCIRDRATDEEKFRDEFFTDIDLCDENGKNVMLLGLDVLPEYRGPVSYTHLAIDKISAPKDVGVQNNLCV